MPTCKLRLGPSLKFVGLHVPVALALVAAYLIAACALLLALAGAADARSGKPPARHKLAKPGTVVSAVPLQRRLWVPGTNGASLTFKTYDNDHLGAWIESQPDAIRFVRELFTGKGG
jgi:hypothetical protein